jgi:predicted lipoprotein
MRWTGWLITTMVVAGLCWMFPLFHVVPLERAAREKQAAIFNPAEFAATFWSEKLLKSLDSAVPAEELISAMQSDPAAAKQRYSRSVGVSESYTYFLRGQGRVLVVGEDQIALAISRNATNAEVVLQVGVLFGNAIRDGTGLLNVNDFPNSQDFNAISEQLNRLVESRVQPKLREIAKAGAFVKFAGCAEVNDESSDLQPLNVVPVFAELGSKP